MMKLSGAALVAVTALVLTASLVVGGCGDEFEEEEATVEKKGGGEGGGAGATAEVGDNLSLKGTSYKVTNAETGSSIGDKYTREEANGIFVIVDLTVTNLKDEPATIDEANLHLIGGNGDTYSTSDEALLVYSKTFFLEETQPDVPESGKLVYDIPPTAVAGAKLQVEDFWSDSTGDIDLGLK